VTAQFLRDLYWASSLTEFMMILIVRSFILSEIRTLLICSVNGRNPLQRLRTLGCGRPNLVDLIHRFYLLKLLW